MEGAAMPRVAGAGALPLRRRAVAAAGSTMRLARATVLEDDSEPGRHLVDLDGLRVAAQRGAGCLVHPEPGDLVLVAAATESGGEAFVISVLRRARVEGARIGVAGSPDMTIAQPILRLACDELEADADRVTLRARATRYLGEAATAVLDRIDVLFRALNLVGDRSASKLGTQVRIVDGVDTLVAGQVAYKANETMTLRSADTVMTAKADVRIDAERISLG